MSKIKNHSGKWPRPDGVELAYTSLVPPKPKGTVVILHGLGEHSARYLDFARFLNRHGWTVYFYDQRGHGKSGGPRMYADDIGQLAEDLGAFLSWVAKKNPGSPLFLFAHSFGAQVAANYLAGGAQELDGAVFSAPNLKVAVPIFFLKRLAAKALTTVLPRLLVANDIPPEYISRDPQVVEHYKRDPLIQDKISVQLGTKLLDNVDRISELAPLIKLPVFFLHGSADKITSPEGSREFYDRLGSADKSYKSYRGFFHELINEPGKEEVYNDVEHWLEKRAKHAGRKNSAA